VLTTTKSWERGSDPEGARAATRVVDAQRQAATTLRLTLAFLVAGVAAALAGAGSWTALHLVLVGGVLTAIAGASQLLAVTWSAAPAPAERLVQAQRWCLAAGAVAVVVGRRLDLVAVVAVGAVGTAAGLVALAAALLGIRGAGRNDRFRPAIDAYVAGIASACLAVALGAWLASATPGERWLDVRAAHVTLNVFGLVGIVIAATLPAFVATQARTRMSARATARNQRLVTSLLLVGVASIAAGQLAGSAPVTGVGRVAYVVGLLGLLALLPPVGRRQLRWAGPRLIQLGAGIAWWIGTGAALAVADLTDQQPPVGLIPALAVGGIAQIVVASLAYFGPVLRGGGHQRLSAGFATTRSWVSLVAGNVAAAALLLDLRSVAAVALVVWTADLLARAAHLRAAEPMQPEEPQEAP
jgi:nitrite reductase (NO-forming)